MRYSERAEVDINVNKKDDRIDCLRVKHAIEFIISRINYNIKMRCLQTKPIEFQLKNYSYHFLIKYFIIKLW